MSVQDVVLPSFTYDDTAEYLARLSLRPDLVLVCGQAINFWAEQYRGRVPELDREGPFSSKDTDFLGNRAAVEYCARKLSGTVSRYEQRPREAAPCIGVIAFLDANGRKHTIDILREMAGVDIWPPSVVPNPSMPS